MYLELENVSKVIDGNRVLNEVSYSFDSGKIYGICGKNGCGKTMLMKAVCGLNSIQSGSISVGGKKLGSGNEFPESVGALIENPGFINQYSGLKNLKILADIKGNADEERIRDKKAYKKYSLGMKQKVGIICAIMEHPKMIILDEPTNALDEDSVKELNKIIMERKEDGALILVASHDRQELEMVADEIINMRAGEIV